MLSNYFKIAFRSLWNNKLYSTLNIAGLAAGIAVALLIGLWVADEIAFNRYNKDCDRIALLQKNRTYNGAVHTETSCSVPLAEKLRASYGSFFEAVVVSSYGSERTLQYKETSVIKRGYFMEPGGQEILDLQLVKGSVVFPLDPGSVLLSESVSRSLFGDEDPLEKTIRIDNKLDLKIAGVYKNLPNNSTFRNVNFYAAFDAFANMEEWVREARSDWEENSFPVYLKTAPHVSMAQASAAIREVAFEHTKDESHPELFLFAMSDWHLFPEFKNGKPVGAGLQTLWIFGLTGVFVLLLAAINFMNLSTARSEKRAREIGIRKSVGSRRGQLIRQFYVETFLVVFFAGILAIVAAQLSLPWFNHIAEKKLAFAWNDPLFWTPLLGFLVATGLLAGSYPALYLSSFHPVSVLKGQFKTGFREVFSRKILVVFQFAVSVTLIISTVIISRQVRHAKNRPIGYESSGLIQIRKQSPNLVGHFYAMRQDLHDTGAVVEMAESSGPVTEFWTNSSGFQWRGKPAGLSEDFITMRVTPEFGKTIGWQIAQGRDFSRAFSLDSSAIILNESAAKLMGFASPLNEMIRYEGKNYLVVGVARDFVMDSPYEPVKPTVFTMRKANMPFVSIRLNPAWSASAALEKVAAVFEKYAPGESFNFKFIDTEFGLKFWREERVAHLTVVFSIMAIFISLLGIFGLATFVAEQRTKEIGVRKVLGAGVLNVWMLLSRDLVVLVLLAFFIATPVAWYFMHDWLMHYDYRTEMSWWVFAASGLGALAVTLLTVSFQSLKAALANPVRSLKSE